MLYKKSLKIIKKDMVQKEQVFKAIKRAYKHLHYLSESDILDYFEVSSVIELRVHIPKVIPHDGAGQQFDLRVMDSCLCTDGYGNMKELYDSEKEAERRVEMLLAERGLNLGVYPCPYNCGWHLTKG